MLKSVTHSLLIPISRPNKISLIGPRNLSGCITNKDHLYRLVTTTEGTLGVKYTRGQFDVYNSNLLTPTKIPSHTSLGIEGDSACKCQNAGPTDAHVNKQDRL